MRRVVWAGTSLSHKAQLEGMTEEDLGQERAMVAAGATFHPGELSRTEAACAATFALVLQQEPDSGSGNSR